MASSNNGNVKSTPVGGDGDSSSSGVTATGGEPEEHATIGHVSIKPPEFSESNAAGWFAILEAQFFLGKVKASSTKFFHSVAALPASVVGRISPEVLGKQSFDALKETVLSLVERSKPEIFENLIQSKR